MVVAPPHIAKGEELFDLIAVVCLAFLPAVRVSINRRRGVVEQQGLAVPIEPAVLIARRLVEALVEALDNINHVAVEGPEAELRDFVAESFHLLHGCEQHFPFVPIADGIRDIHDEDIDACIGQHGEVVEADIAVLAEEVAVFRFAPVVGGVGKVWFALRTHRILLEQLCHVVGVRLSVVKILRVPSNVEDAYGSWFICLERILLSGGQSSAQAIGGNKRRSSPSPGPSSPGPPSPLKGENFAAA